MMFHAAQQLIGADPRLRRSVASRLFAFVGDLVARSVLQASARAAQFDRYAARPYAGDL